ncbi:MAG: RDD family protein [Opitutaceae bacterium]|nr:RDD family protein [Opitutaceae bacterium]
MTSVRILLSIFLLTLGLARPAFAFTLILEAESGTRTIEDSGPAPLPEPPPASPGADAPQPPAPPAPEEEFHRDGEHPGHPDQSAQEERAGEEGAAEEHSDEPPPDEWEGDHGQEVVMTFFQDAIVGAGQNVQVAMAVRGNTLVEGKIREAAMAYAGDTLIEGSTAGPAMAFFGNVHVNGRVGGEVICILGDVTLGPKAYVGGQIVAIGGQIHRAEGAVVRGQVVNIALTPGAPELGGLQAWIRDAVFFGRPLCFNAKAWWIWWFASAFLAVYLIIGIIAPRAVLRCVETLETRPGRTLAAAVLSAFLMPLIFVLLLVTVVGAPVFGFFAMACAVFGKAAFLVWLGRRFGVKAPVLALLVGGLVLTALYLIPVLGFLAYLFATGLGVGMAVYTLMLVTRRERKAPVSAAPSAPVGAVPAGDGGFSPEPTGAAVAANVVAPAGVSTPPPLVPPRLVPPPTDDPATAERAGFMIRLGASIIDIVVVAIVSSLLGLTGGFLMLGFVAYCVVLWVFRGATVGGIICGLKLVRLDGEPLDWLTAGVRALGGFVSLAILGLGFLWVAFDDEAQSWHDRIAGTTIIRSRNRRGLV